MKTFKYFIRKLTPLLLTGFLFVSCGTHNSNDYDESDGIYSTDNTSTVEEDTAVLENEKNNYYKQYFKTKELTYSDVPEDNVIFTDVEAYHSTESLDEDGYVVLEEETYNDDGYGAWGTNGTETTINVYGGYGYSPYWGGGYWGMSFGWGWGYPYYGYGWGYPHYGYGWGYPYYGGGYYNGYAYNRGRRNTDYYASRSSSRSNTGYSRGRTTSSRGNSSYTSRRGTYSRGETSRRSSYRNSNNTVRRSGSSTQSRNSVSRSNTSRKSTNYNRPSSNSSRSNSYRSSGSSHRSSGSFRSSGGSRSGGGSRGGGGGRRGGL